MKTVLEQLMELNEKLAKLEKEIMGTSTEFESCCSGECDCGCDEPPVEVEDEAPEFDSAGFTYEDRVVDGQYMVTTESDPQDAIVRAQTITFTYDELIDFATRLTRRTVDACKEAVELATFDDSDICDVSLNWNHTIEIEINNGRIHRDIVDEIEHAADFDESSIDVDVRNVLTDMHLDSIS
jgi:hypothetical protein